MDAKRRALASLARRFPAAAALGKPLLLPLLRLLPQPTIAETSPFPSPVSAAAPPKLLVPVPRKAAAEANARLVAVADGDEGAGLGARAEGRDILMLVVSDLRIDPRVRREARALADHGYRVTVVCPSPFVDTEAPPEIQWGDGIDILYVGVACGNYVGEHPGFMGGLLFDVVERVLAGRRFLAVHAHDLNTAYVALAFARLTGAHFVADFHEWTSENVHWDDALKAWRPYPSEWKVQLQELERRIMREASAVITVSPSIVDAIAQELGDGRRPALIRNIPDLASTPSTGYDLLRSVLAVREDQFLILYQGGIGPTRRIEPVIMALKHAPGCVLAIRGPCMDLFGNGYRQVAEEAGVADRLHLLEAVPSSDVVAAARGADAGLYTVVGVCRNYELALPNKVYEYIAAGLPVLVSDYPEVSRFVREAGIGLVFDPEDPESIASAMNQLARDPALSNRFRRNAGKTLRSVDGEREWQKLVELYNALPVAAAAQPGNLA
ncbi:glycosyltransferase family 4 protein [Bosea thiooxidans]